MTEATPPAPLGEDALPVGCITKTRNGQRWFYPHGESPYLDNAVECVTVYAEAQLSTLRDQVARLERERDEGSKRAYENGHADALLALKAAPLDVENVMALADAYRTSNYAERDAAREALRAALRKGTP